MVCIHKNIMLIAVMLTLALHAPSVFAQDADIVGTYETEKAEIEKQIKAIADTPAKPGESLQDEIKRKQKETRDLRRRLKEKEQQIADHQKKKAKDATAKKEASKTGNKEETAAEKYDRQRAQIDKDMKALTKPRTFSTKCKPCKWMETQLTLLDKQRYSFESQLLTARGEYIYKIYELDEEIETLKNSGRKKTGGLRTAFFVLGLYSEVENEYTSIKVKIEAQLAAVNQQMATLLAQLAECEKQCNITKNRSGIIGSLPEAKTTTAATLPFDWKGPYSTECKPCVKLAARLNELPPLVRERLAKIALAELELERIAIQDTLNAYGGDDDYSYGNDKWKKRKIETLYNEIKKLKNQIRNITNHFNVVLKMLRDCEAKYCGQKVGCVLPGHKLIFIPSGTIGTSENTDESALCSVEVELDYTISQFGTNAFDAQEIQRIPDIVIGAENTTTGTTNTGTTDTTNGGTTTGGDTTTTTDGGGTTTGGDTTTATPLAVNANGNVSFAHTVGSSPCPQSAGTIMISSNNGNALTVSGVSTSGTLATRLTNSVNGSGSANPTITAQFNCSSSDNGSFSGNVTGNVTDSVTGETSTFSVPANGTVTGP